MQASVPPVECYCAICSGPFTPAKTGSENPLALERRRDRIRGILARGLDPDYFSEPSESGEGNAAQNDAAQDDAAQDEELHTYDPHIATEENQSWLPLVLGLGFDPGLDTPDKAFLTGRANYIGGSRILDVNSIKFTCYRHDGHFPAVFPIHELCFVMLLDVLELASNTEEIDMNALYDTLCRFNEGNPRLEVDYGDINGAGLFWHAIPGEEFSVADPIEVASFYEELKKQIDCGRFQPDPAPSHVGRPTDTSDRFACLPLETIHRIMEFLPLDSVIPFVEGSKYADWAAGTDKFWENLIRKDLLPLLWDLEETIPLTEMSQLNHRELFKWLQDAMEVEWAKDPAFTGISNRKRIWGVSQQIADMYCQVAHRQPPLQPNAQILEQALCRHALMLTYPATGGRETRSTFWIHSWEELEDFQFVLETFWSSTYNTLTGIALVVGSSRRLFGSDQGALKSAAVLTAGEWLSVSGIILKMPDPSRAALGQPVYGVKLCLESGQAYSFGASDANFLCSRVLFASQGSKIVGMCGEVNAGGNFCRVGVIECPYQAREPSQSGMLNVLPQEKIMWEPSIPTDYISTLRGTSSVFTPLAETPPTEGVVPPEFIPHQLLLWAELEEFQRISAFAPTVPSDGSRAGIVAMRAELLQNYQEYAWVGSVQRPQLGLAINIPGVTFQMDIDGPGGERITEIGISKTPRPAALMFKTNRGNRAIFGGPYRSNWVTWAAPQGSSIFGIAVGFGDWDRILPGALSLSSVLVIHKRDDQYVHYQA